MFTAIIWIGRYGSFTQGGFETADAAGKEAQDRIDRGAHGERDDLVVEVQDESGKPVSFLGIPVLTVVREVADAFGMNNLPNTVVTG